eukprot:366115-Chlamydomonas_euryale.AAC.12
MSWNCPLMVCSARGVSASHAYLHTPACTHACTLVPHSTGLATCVVHMSAAHEAVHGAALVRIILTNLSVAWWGGRRGGARRPSPPGGAWRVMRREATGDAC